MTATTAALAALGLLAAAYVVPDALMHRLGLWTATRGRPGLGKKACRSCALTFDDGPDAQSTALILDVLRKHGCHATFFVLGEKAARFPRLVERIAAEGHEIGLHGWDHRHPWLLCPWTCRSHLVRAATAVARCAEGRLPVKYRPPWGFWSLWTVLGSAGFERVMWSLPGGDWKKTTTPESLAALVCSRAEPGSVVLLHDGADYSWKTASALEPILCGLKSKGLRPTTVAELMEEAVET